MPENLPLPMVQKTIYFTIGMQMYMAETIKKPIVEATAILFNPKSSRVQKIKALRMLWKVFEAMKGLPEPTKENTWHPNTHALIDLRDWLFERCSLNVFRMGFVRRIMNFVIVLYDFDPPWRWILDSLKDEALKKEWKPRGFSDTWRNTYTWWKEK